MTALRGRGRARKALSALGVIAAVAVTLNVNLLSGRFYQRWDLTSEGFYTLSEPTRRTLQALTEPVEIIVLLSRSDPIGTSLKHLLSAYRAESEKVSFRELDPDQNPAEFSAIQKEYGVIAGQTEQGEAYTDASVIIAQAERHWFVTADELVRIEPDGEHVRPALEQALTEGIANVVGTKKTTLCFSRGHQEQGLGDAGPDGLSELHARMEKNNYVVEERELGGERAGSMLEGCRVLVIAGPRLPFDPASGEQVAAAARGGMSVFALLAPLVGEGGRVVSSGLEAVARVADAELGANLVLETEAKRRAPRGVGEVFFATPEPHAVTRGLTRSSGEAEFDVIVSEAQSVRSLGAATALLRTSDHAIALENLRPILERDGNAAVESKKPERFTLAVARELSPNGAAPAARLVLAGSATLAQNRSFRDPALYGDRLFVENAVAWLSARPALVSVPEKGRRELGLALSEDSLSEILLYVLVYMPATAGLLGAFVLLRRRSLETRSRRSAKKSAKKPDARP